MMLKSKSTQPKRSAWTLMRAGLAGLAVLVGGAAATTGCLDRPVKAQEPQTSNVYVDEIRQTAVDKIDLLFMIDNSISMADKQAILAEAVPLLVTRLITPLCVRPCEAKDNCTPAQEKDGLPAGGNADSMGQCASGSPEFSPIRDIHVGVVTSSLGSHGAAGGKDICTAADDNDHAQLLGAIRMGQTTYQNQGFLKWDTTKAKYTPPGTSDATAFNDAFTKMVTSAGESGCGYEASLEAWYRFLVDPDPPQTVAVDPMTSTSVKQGTDMTILAQRAAFLRPDSLVAIIMLSDENDCSIRDDGYGYLVARTSPMFRSTSQCAANPNDPCCQSCAEGNKDGCPAVASNSECAKGKTLAAGTDDLNLRCYEQKRRFGLDLLYETSRYSDGLRSPTVPDRMNQLVENPLFKPGDGKAARDPGLVFLAGIIGVPWQDIADEASLSSADSLRYLTATELEMNGRWDVILGDPKASPPKPPADPLMVEQPDERMGMNPITKDAIAPSSSTSPTANKINGHEQVNMGNSDLQYACIFPLAKPLTCDDARNMAGGGCDCFTEDLPFNRPLCQPPGGGAATTTQSFAKAYPGTRHLEVLREFGDNSIVASICPKVTDNKQPDYGYNPAVKAVIDRLKEALKGKCLPRPLVPNNAKGPDGNPIAVDGLEPGQVPCAVVEALLRPKDQTTCSCDAGQGRIALDDRPQLREAVLKKLRDGNTCDQEKGTKCSDYCTCELAQLKGKDLQDCQSNPTPPNVPGYCYINAAPNEPKVGEPSLVKDCPADQKRLLRFVGNTPAQGSIALVACLGASLGNASDMTASTP